MFFLTPSYVKQGRQFMKDAQKMLDYKRDLVSPEVAEAVHREIGHLDVALRGGEEAAIEQQVVRLDEACEKLGKPPEDAGVRENVEVFLVAIVIALGVRTYFLQPFTIPTGSMQPTLNGIIGHPTREPLPNPIVQAVDFALFGRSYVDVTALADESITSIEESKRYLFLTYTLIHTSRDNVYAVHAPATVVQRDLLQPTLSNGGSFYHEYKAGERIVHGYVTTGDHVFVDKASYNFRPPHRGEVFVFTTQKIAKIAARTDTSQFYIKRLAGVPGDTLRIAAPNLFINGTRANTPAFERVESGTEFQPHDGYHGYGNINQFPLLSNPEAAVHLDKDEYFALGDNSYQSSDSRDWGPVPERNIMGHAVFVYWPFGPHWGLIH